MNGGWPKRRNQGFTIIEVLIVLAVSGLLLTAALVTINGKQRVTSFNQSIRNLQTELQQIVNDVGSGYYPNNGTISCANGGPGGGVKLTSGAASQGTNVDCIFLGKVLQFAVGSNDPEIYNVYTLAGLRGNIVSPSLDLKSAKARVIAKGTAATDTGIPDAFESKRLLYGLTVSHMYYSNAAGAKVADIAAVGFTMNINSLGDADGSQHVDIVAVPNTTLHVDKSNGVQQINDSVASIDKTKIGTTIDPPGGVQICVNSGGTEQSALISLGGSDRQGTVDVQVFYTKDCI